MPVKQSWSNHTRTIKFALLGKKVGMTQIFAANGDVIPVTVVQVGPCTVLQKKTIANDGYAAVQLGFDDKKKQRVLKPEAGHAGKAKAAAKRFVKEIRLTEEEVAAYEFGQVLTADNFIVGDKLDVVGISIGKGFAGVVKRHGFHGANSSHNHEFFRHPGSIGNRSDPSKVFKNKKLPGQMGAHQVTIQNLTVAAIEPETNHVLIKGAIPGSKNGYLILKASAKGKFAARKPGGASAGVDAPAADAQ